MEKGHQPHDGGQELAGVVAVRGDTADQGFPAVRIITALLGINDLPPQLFPQTQVDAFAGHTLEDRAAGRTQSHQQVAQGKGGQLGSGYAAVGVYHVAGEHGDVQSGEGAAHCGHKDEDDKQPGHLDSLEHGQVFPKARLLRPVVHMLFFHWANTS